MAKAWKPDLKAGAAAIARKNYERLLLAFEWALSAKAPERPIQNTRGASGAKATDKKARLRLGCRVKGLYLMLGPRCRGQAPRQEADRAPCSACCACVRS